jgi:hypothetical protein
MARPRRQEPARYVHLTLEPADFELLEAYAHQVGAPAATLARKIVIDVLRGAQLADGSVDPSLIEQAIRSLRGEPVHRPQEVPRWEWSLEAILSDRSWWDRWLPELYRLFGRELRPPAEPGQRSAFGRQEPQARAGSVLNREGYADLMEFLFPTVTTSKGAVTWRSLSYPIAAEQPAEAELPLAPAWEATIRHLVTALCALESSSEPKASANHRILTEQQIRGPWRETLLAIVGEGSTALPSKRLL